MKKRILAMILSVVLVVGVLPEASLGAALTVDELNQELSEIETEAEVQEAIEEIEESTESKASMEATESTEIIDSTESTEVAGNPQDEALLEDLLENTGYIQPRVVTLDITEAEIQENTVDSTGVRAVSEWDKYANNYFYNMMNEDEQAFYDALDELAYSYLVSSRDVPDIRYNPQYMDAVCYGPLSPSEAGNVWQLFRQSNPQYYFLLSGYGFAASGANYLFMGIYPEFSYGYRRNEATQKFQYAIGECLNIVSGISDTVEKEKYIHDWVIKRVTYDPEYDEKMKVGDNAFWQYEITEGYTQSAYSVFAKEKKATVCAGYAMAFALLCNAVGIESINITSFNHQWNRVRLNGSWYNVDCTWDDPYKAGQNGDGVMYNFFNRSTVAIYVEDSSTAHTQESIFDKYMSSARCVLDSGADDTSIGTIAAAKGSTAAPGITSTASGSEVKITLTSPTANARIYYTTDGTTPSVSATKSRYYNAPFTIKKNTTVKAIAVADAYNDSSAASNAVSGYTVKFDSKGGSSVAAIYTLANTAITKPSNPKKSGYTFIGWYKESTCKNAWKFTTKVTANTTVYAKWSKTYTIKYTLNKGTNNKNNPKNYTALTTTIKLQSPARTGYVFKGWYKDSKFKTKITQIKKGSTSNLKLYAKWEKITTPKKAQLSKLTNKSGKKLAVTIKKQSGVTGYQIRYATKSSMSGAKKKIVTSTAVTLKGLSPKTYYVQVRAYKEDSKGKKYYGKWSDKKSISITK